MANYQINGTQTLRRWMRDNGKDHNLIPRLAAGLNIPVLELSAYDGKTVSSFSKRISEAEAQNLADLLGTTVADLKTETILTELP